MAAGVVFILAKTYSIRRLGWLGLDSIRPRQSQGERGVIRPSFCLSDDASYVFK